MASQKSKLLWVALVSVAAIIAVHFISTWQQTNVATSGAGPQPSSAGGGAGA